MPIEGKIRSGKIHQSRSKYTMLSQGNARMGHLDKMDSVKYSMALL